MPFLKTVRQPAVINRVLVDDPECQTFIGGIRMVDAFVSWDGKVKGLFAWGIQGQPVCDDCHSRVDPPKGGVNVMSIGQLRDYMAFREQNDRLKKNFQATHRVEFDSLATSEKSVSELRLQLPTNQFGALTLFRTLWP